MANTLPTPEEVRIGVKIQATDFIVSTPKIKDDPLEALGEAIDEAEKGEGSRKSIALIVLSQSKYLQYLERQVDGLVKQLASLEKEIEKLKIK